MNQILLFVQDLAGRWLLNSHQHSPDRGLPTPGLSYQSQGFSLKKLKADAVHRMQKPAVPRKQ